MARTRILPDTAVFASVRALLATGGDKAVSFGAVARATGLAPSTLAQRFGTVAAMRSAALRDGWQALAAETEAALATVADKGAQGVLKALDGVAEPVALLLATATDAEARALATDWRRQVEAALMLRLGQGDKAREGAAILFAAWQGQMLWDGDGFRLKDAVKRLT
ncbi:MAG: transcriptional regulator [Fuscovulum sp.]|jgi:AcrR family transcriptional regulator|nr:transcriptional regulator [Fuscovulum sp.]